jgi:hemerythrin superfamily protein
VDVTQLLSDQHRQVEGLFEQFEQSADPAAKGRIARQVVALLSKHSGVEEMDVYPAIEHEVSRAAAESLTHEHQEPKKVLADIESCDDGSPELVTKMAQAKLAVAEHVAEEEGQVFPRLRRELGQDRLDDLGETIMSKWEGAPTHPHPNQPPANKVTGPMVGLADKARDAIRSRS